MNTKSCGFLGVRELRSVPTAYKTAMMRGYRNPIQTHRVNVRIHPVPVAPLPDWVHSANCSDAPVRTKRYNLRRVRASHLAASFLCQHPPPLRRACIPVPATYARPNAKPAACLLLRVCPHVRQRGLSPRQCHAASAAHWPFPNCPSMPHVHACALPQRLAGRSVGRCKH